MKTKIISLILLFSVAGIISAFRPTPSTKLSDYVGRYVFPYNQAAEEVIINLRNDSLFATASLGTVQLKYIAEDNFEIPEYGGEVTFTRKDSTKVVSTVKVIIPAASIEIEGKKVQNKQP